MGVDTIHFPLPSPPSSLGTHLLAALSLLQEEAEAARLRQWWAWTARSGGSPYGSGGQGSGYAGGLDSTQYGGQQGQTRPGQPVEKQRRAFRGEPKPAQPVARWRSGGKDETAQSGKVQLQIVTLLH